MLSDLRHGIRTLLQAKAWTAVVVLSLALGIGANTALFGAVNGVLLRKVAVHDPDSLVRLKWAGDNDVTTDSSDFGYSSPDAAGRRVRATVSYAMFQQLAASNQTMSELLACAPFGRVNAIVDGQANVATAFIASGNYFQMLRAPIRLGRAFTPDDDRPGAAPVAVISHRFWQSHFGGAADVIGRSVPINTVPLTIIGVTGPEFTGIQTAVQEPPDLTVPLVLERQLNIGNVRLDSPTSWWLQVMGRLKPGVTVAQAQANLETVFQHTAREMLTAYLSGLSDAERMTVRNQSRRQIPSLRIDSGSRGFYDANTTDRRALVILGVVVVLMLLIVCANVANLLLSRAAARQKEVSVRLSLGATRGRLVRQLLTESLLLAAAGGVLGLLIGYWGKQLLPGALGQPTPLDWRMLAFVGLVTSVTAIVFGTAPALRATGVSVNTALKEHSRAVVAGRSRLTKTLLVAQVSISLVLLIGAGLFLRTVQNLRNVDVGFQTQNLVLLDITPSFLRYDDARVRLLYRNLITRIGAVGGVQAAGFSQPALLSGSQNNSAIYIQGRRYAPGEIPSIYRLVVSPGFVDMMRIPLLTGRLLSEGDHETAPKVVVINAAAARQFFPNQNPIGQRFGHSVETAGELEIVGVVADAKYNSVRAAVPPTMYVPFAQTRMTGPTFAVRTAGEPMGAVGAIREAVRQLDPNLPITNVATQMERVEERLQQERLFANAYAMFGLLALLLASVGLFGLMSYSVARRTSEIGIRMALGAQRGNVLRLVMGESMSLVLVGTVVGLAAALAAGQLVASQLFGVEAADVTTMAIAIGVMLSVALAAGYLPARRASRVDPMVALRDQ